MRRDQSLGKIFGSIFSDPTFASVERSHSLEQRFFKRCGQMAITCPPTHLRAQVLIGAGNFRTALRDFTPRIQRGLKAGRRLARDVVGNSSACSPRKLGGDLGNWIRRLRGQRDDRENPRVISITTSVPSWMNSELNIQTAGFYANFPHHLQWRNRASPGTADR